MTNPFEGREHSLIFKLTYNQCAQKFPLDLFNPCRDIFPSSLWDWDVRCPEKRELAMLPINSFALQFHQQNIFIKIRWQESRKYNIIRFQ
jgi:hypothetical protein